MTGEWTSFGKQEENSWYWTLNLNFFFFLIITRNLYVAYFSWKFYNAVRWMCCSLITNKQTRIVSYTFMTWLFISGTRSKRSTHLQPQCHHSFCLVLEFRVLIPLLLLLNLKFSIFHSSIKLCLLDSPPTWLLKTLSPQLITICWLLNLSLVSGVYSTSLKFAVVYPYIEKSGLDLCDINS